jgi:hypothetical protein
MVKTTLGCAPCSAAISPGEPATHMLSLRLPAQCLKLDFALQRAVRLCGRSPRGPRSSAAAAATAVGPSRSARRRRGGRSVSGKARSSGEAWRAVGRDSTLPEARCCCRCPSVRAFVPAAGSTAAAGAEDLPSASRCRAARVCGSWVACHAVFTAGCGGRFCWCGRWCSIGSGRGCAARSALSGRRSRRARFSADGKRCCVAGSGWCCRWSCSVGR